MTEFGSSDLGDRLLSFLFAKHYALCSPLYALCTALYALCSTPTNQRIGKKTVLIV